MPLAFLAGGAAEGCSLIEENIISDFGCFPDNHSSTVVNKETAADSGARMDFNAGKETAEEGKHTGRQPAAVAPQKAGYPVQPEGMHARIAADNFNDTPGGRVPANNCPNIFS
jgi:hypothetical protein